MNTEPSYRQIRFQVGQPSLLGRIVTLLLSIAAVILGFMFSLVALAVVIVIALLFGGWLWWKTRALRRALRASAAAATERPATDDYIDGEVVRTEEIVVALPRHPVNRPPQ